MSILWQILALEIGNNDEVSSCRAVSLYILEGRLQCSMEP